MIEAESTATATAAAGRVRGQGQALDDLAAILPPQPKTVRDSGLERSLIVELIAKSMHIGGKTHLPVLVGRLKLSINVLREVLDGMVAEQMVEVAWRGESELDVQYQLTSVGKLCALEYQARCRYAGPAPVTLAAYREVAQRQSCRHPQAAHLRAPELAAALADDGLEPAVRDMIGAAMHAGRPLLLFGPSGSGKTTLARKLGRMQQGVVAVPYAILVGQQIIAFHDPVVHQPPSPLLARQAEERRSVDTRWALCQRPVVQVGAELTPDMLDLRYDEAGGVYHAPPHFMANGGMLVVDDLGRQRMSSGDLLNRWTGPLDLGVDQLTMHGGHKVSVPFDATLVLATNLAPHLLLDDSFLRRIGYKVHIGPLSEASYRNLFRHQCRGMRIVFDEAVLDHLVKRLHAATGKALLASYPRELLGRIDDFAGYTGIAPRLTVAALEQAWVSMFAGGTAGAASPSQPPAQFKAVASDILSEKI
ncbi:ATP-binding protein [Massilia glaciei]|uniref:ATP-binding protein n=1 Tax=Massilia glaciei TaxID=1524097 RepID=UPI0015E81545|nr:ATP-binding protein [Massilia glaciei]